MSQIGTIVVDDLRYVSRIKIDSVISKGKGVPVKCHAATEFEWRYISTLSLTLTLDGVGGQRHALTALPPGKEPHYLLYRRLGVPQGLSELYGEEKIIFLTGIFFCFL